MDYWENTVPLGATHWLVGVGSQYVISEDGECHEIVQYYNVMSGYIENDIFYITPEPSEGDAFSFVHKKSMDEIYQNIFDTENEINHGLLFKRTETEGIHAIYEITFSEVKKIS